MLPYHGTIPRGDKLKSLVRHLLQGKKASDFVIALTDIHIDGKMPIFEDAKDAKHK